MRAPLRLALLLTTVAPAVAVPAQTTPHHKLLAWSELGLNGMDRGYSVFAIMPPFVNVHAQVIDGNGRLVTSDAGLRVTYEAVADTAGSTNRTSIGKSDFWRFAPALFGVSLAPNAGLLGFDMPGLANRPRAMAFDAASAVFHADGVPVTPYDDDLHRRTYPTMRFVLRDAAGTELAHTGNVLPTAELQCFVCHASGYELTQPGAGYAWDPDARRDERRNILRLHDDLNASPIYEQALRDAGYNPAGLAATVETEGRPILCARCHPSRALPGSGLPGRRQLTTAVHNVHAYVLDPEYLLPLENIPTRDACYRCHAGAESHALRGVMGRAVGANGVRAVECQACHGTMSALADFSRRGWLDQPSCQNCHTGTATHNSGELRYTNAFDAPGHLRVPVDPTFATNPDTPVPGASLYRASIGHGNLRCQACHGATHAEYPSGHADDNQQSLALQGHAGMLVDCTACHRTMPRTASGGPHGMHSISDEWCDDHADSVRSGGIDRCRACHGADDRGTVLSAAQGDRTFSTHFGTKVFARGARVSCYACHNGPNSSNANPNRAPVAADAAASAADQPVTIPLIATDPDNDPLSLRVVDQPAHGRVSIAGTVATYAPDPGFAGIDSFTFMARDAALDSNPATVRVRRGAGAVAYGSGYAGSNEVVPALAVDAPPVLGTTITLSLENTGGSDGGAVLLLARERARLATPFGGELLAEPTVAAAVFLPAAGLHLPWSLPNDPALVGARVCMQALELDPGAHFGVAFTRGLALDLGR